jgi:hypothetical protein
LGELHQPRYHITTSIKVSKPARFPLGEIRPWNCFVDYLSLALSRGIIVTMARYNENYFRMLAYMERMLSSGADHWFPDQDAPGFVKSPSIKQVKHASLHAAIYASVFGQIPAYFSVYSICGHSWCVRPGHQALHYTGRSYPIVDMREDLSKFAKNHAMIMEAGWPSKSSPPIPSLPCVHPQ